jgi:hypothetical protein
VTEVIPLKFADAEMGFGEIEFLLQLHPPELRIAPMLVDDLRSDDEAESVPI